jgi:hypothetical protein
VPGQSRSHKVLATASSFSHLRLQTFPTARESEHRLSSITPVPAHRSAKGLPSTTEHLCSWLPTCQVSSDRRLPIQPTLLETYRRTFSSTKDRKTAFLTCPSHRNQNILLYLHGTRKCAFMKLTNLVEREKLFLSMKVRYSVVTGHQ